MVKALMASLHIRMWNGVVRDDDILDFVEEHYGMTRGHVSLLKRIVDKSFIAGINSAALLGRREHHKLTVPGLQDGSRLLPIALWQRYLDTHRVIRDDFNKSVQDFVGQHGAIKDHARRVLGDAFKESDFPTQEALANSFRYSVSFAPVPVVKDWRIDSLREQDMDVLRASVENDVRGMYDNATREVFHRVYAALNKLLQQLESYDPKIGGGQFRDVSVEAYKDIFSLAADMNVMEDPELTLVTDEINQRIQGLQAEDLRKSEAARDTLAASIRRIHAMMEKQEDAA